MISGGAIRHEASLLYASTASDCWDGPSEEDEGEKFPWDGEQCYAPVVGTDEPVAFVFPEWKDDATGHIFGELFFDPNLINNKGKPLCDLVATCPEHLCGDGADSWSLTIL